MQPTYSRQDLQRLSAERLAALKREKIERLVFDLKQGVLSAAQGTGKMQAFHPLVRPSNAEDLEITHAAIGRLRDIFPGVTVEYIEDPGAVTGIRFDWS